MASPQKENGYTAIANELMEALIRFRLPGELSQVLGAVIRKTYGFNKSEDAIANSQIVELTGLKKGNVSRSLSRLITHRLVIKTDNKTKRGHVLKINKDYTQWIPIVIKTDNPKKGVKKLSKRKPKLSRLITPVIKSDNKKLSKLRDTKDSKDTLKDTLQKKEAQMPPPLAPKDKAEMFFRGVEALMKKEEVPWLQETLAKLCGEDTSIQRRKIVWNVVRDFSMYWTEKTHTGRQERWQTQKTFEVHLRLATWFRKERLYGFNTDSLGVRPKGKKIISSSQ